MEKKKANKGNGKNVTAKAATGTLVIVFMSIAIFLITNLLFPFRQMDARGEFRDIMMNSMMISAAISSTMLILSIYLIYIYLKDYFELKSRFTLGILLVVISFMLFAITSNPLLHALLGIYGNPGLFTLIPILFATISLGILAWISSS